MLTQLRELFSFNHWANERVFGVCARLSPDELVRQLGGSFPSVWTTLAHTYGAELTWFARWKGTPTGRASDLGETADLVTLGTRWAELWLEQSSWLMTLTEEDVRRSIAIVLRSGSHFDQQLGATMYHCINHSTYHRGQTTNYLRMLGVEPVALDLVLYYQKFPPAD